MSEFSWNEQQKQAIEVRGADVLVSAAAGSGKTTVLTERLLRCISAGTDVSRLLVVTFTEAAAEHMRSSIAKALGNKITDPATDPGQAAVLKAQLTKLPSANIKTLHSFCLDITREYFAYVDYDLGSRVMDENEASLMRGKMMSELLDREAQGQNSHIMAQLLPILSKGKTQDSLASAIYDLYDLIWEQPFPELWMEQKLSCYTPEAIDRLWLPLIKEQINRELPGLLDDAIGALEIWIDELNLEIDNIRNGTSHTSSRRVASQEAYLEKANASMDYVEDLQARLRQAMDSTDWDSVSSVLSRLDSDKICKVSWQKAQGELAAAKSTLAGCIKKLKNFAKDMPIISRQQLEQALAEQYPQVEYLFYLVTQFAQDYRQAKKNASAIDFGDMQRGAMELLWELDRENGVARITQVARELRDRFEQVMEDEYQDSNNLQEWILRAVSDGPEQVPFHRELSPDMTGPGPHMFMVGDIKQSIYGFRNAEPSLFISKYAAFSSDGNPGYRVDLQGNYRSNPRVLDAVNKVFERHMTMNLGGTDYNDQAKLLPGLGEVEPAPGAYEYPVDCYLKGDESSEAEVIAEIIRDAVENRRFYDYKAKSWRNYTYSDIAILMRATKDAGPAVKEVLESAGIPANICETASYLGTYEIRTAISALRITDNPLKDTDLLAVAFSPMFDMPGDIPAILKVLYPEADYYFQRMEALAQARLEDLNTGTLAPQVVADARERCRSFVNTVNSWRMLAKQLPPERLIWHIVTSTGFYHIVQTMSGGNVRAANLRLLFSYAVKYGNSSLKGITNFVRFLERVVERGSDLPSTQQLTDNTVTILTIHKSKGLEFPLVILTRTASNFNTSDSTGPLVMSSQLGIGLKRFDPTMHCRFSSLPHTLIARNCRAENLSEELRLLYVAMTRAQDHLALVCSKRPEKALDPKGFKDSEDASSYSDWLIPAAVSNSHLFNIVDSTGFQGEADPELLLCAVPQTEIGDITPEAQQEILLPEQIEYSYGYTPSKVSVTRIERMFDAEDSHRPMFTELGEISEDEKEPTPETGNAVQELASALSDFIEGLGEERISATSRGTINHLFMEKLDFGQASTMEQLEAQLQRLILSGVFSQAQAHTINLAGVMYAANLPELKALLANCKLHRESSFNMLVDYNRLMETSDLTTLGTYSAGEATTLMQGIIDLWIESAPGEAVLVDYKTGRCTAENLTLYRRQLDIYALALHRLTGRTVTHKYVVFLDEERVCSL